ncbi:MAG: ATP-dependent helicase HrpB, partial [Desulfovibrionaceae bacterium]|nr:ATP-dependent helicase HrpB [Desulfovibrionaceae bacterium]
YQIRMERCAGPETRILVLTEGILTRMLRDEPDLPGTQWLILDEFHERSLHADLGLALAMYCQETLRDGANPLGLLVMSATLDTEALAALLGEHGEPCPVIHAQGRMWPVETRYLPRAAQKPQNRQELCACAASAIRQSLASERGSILVFLPGAGEIHAVEEQLGPLPPDVTVHPLYGDLSSAEQDAAIRPAQQNRRKVVLATSIAETSLTIDGVRIVIDSGFSRRQTFDPNSGMSRLCTVPVSLAEADQRRGRAGRLEEGICLRLWKKEDEASMRRFPGPGILNTALASLRLELALWGISSPSALQWLDMPPEDSMRSAEELLVMLGALDGNRKLTPHGRNMAKLPLHPRMAHMLLGSRSEGLTRAASLMAALSGERDFLKGNDSTDLRLRLAWLAKNSRKNLGSLAERLWKLAHAALPSGKEDKPVDEAIESAGRLLAMAYPERVAMRRPEGGGKFLCANGKGAEVDAADPLAREPFLAVGEMDGAGRNAKIRQAAPLDESDLLELFYERLEIKQNIFWDERTDTLSAREAVRLGALTLRETPLSAPDPDITLQAVCTGLRRMWPTALNWTDEIQEWRARILFLRCLFPEEWPDLRDAPLKDTLETWLAPYLPGITKGEQFGKIDLAKALQDQLNPAKRHVLLRRMQELAPARLTVPSGSSIALRYPRDLLRCDELPPAPPPPVLAVKLQELFGLTVQPCVAEKRVPVCLHLLSPAGRPLQVTTDIQSFWQNAYPDIRKEMRGRYPRHPWPEDPLSAIPTRRAKPRA